MVKRLALMLATVLTAVPAFADNYIWVLQDDDSSTLAVVDPGDAGAVLKSDAASCPIILNTHLVYL